MAESHDSPGISERESFENGYYYFVQALELLSLPADVQCQRMGDYNVAWELKRDVSAAEYLLRSPSSSRLSPVQRRAIEELLSELDRVPTDRLRGGAGRAANLEAMGDPSWKSLRPLATELLRVLEPATKECRRFLNMEDERSS